MEFLEVSIKTNTNSIEILTGFLLENGITGTMVLDKEDFNQFLLNPNREWDYIDDDLLDEKSNSETFVVFYVSDNISGLESLNNIKNSLVLLKKSETILDLGELSLDIKNISDKDWENNWKKYFKPLPIGEKLVIKPTWEDLLEDNKRLVLNIDPGCAFGTGGHETTKLCLEFIEQYVKKDDVVFDIGCGSGILSIGALLLGAKKAFAIDIDPNASMIATENAELNNFYIDKFDCVAGNILNDEKVLNNYVGKNYDVVVANIVADIIIELSVIVPKMLKKGGYFIASGIIDTREADVLKALDECGFEVVKIASERDWVSIVSVL